MCVRACVSWFAQCSDRHPVNGDYAYAANATEINPHTHAQPHVHARDSAEMHSSHFVAREHANIELVA